MLHFRQYFFAAQNSLLFVANISLTLDILTKLVTLSASIFSFYLLYVSRKQDRRKADEIIEAKITAEIEEAAIEDKKHTVL